MCHKAKMKTKEEEQCATVLIQMQKKFNKNKINMHVCVGRIKEISKQGQKKHIFATIRKNSVYNVIINKLHAYRTIALFTNVFVRYNQPRMRT